MKNHFSNKLVENFAKFLVKLLISLLFGVILLIFTYWIISPLFQEGKFSISNNQFRWGLSFIFTLYVYLWTYHAISKFDSFDEFRKAITIFIDIEFLGKKLSTKNFQKDEIIYDEKKSAEAFKIILQLRDVDNNLMWNRINLLLVFQGVLLAAVAAGIKELSAEKYSLVFLAIIGFGFLSSMMLFNIARGGSWWVSHWEQHLAKIERNVVGDIDIFREHISTMPELKKEWKKHGYVSTRDTIIFFTSIIPFIWAIIFLIYIAVSPMF
jgi:hypothetical protein